MSMSSVMLEFVRENDFRESYLVIFNEKDEGLRFYPPPESWSLTLLYSECGLALVDQKHFHSFDFHTRSSKQ